MAARKSPAAGADQIQSGAELHNVVDNGSGQDTSSRDPEPEPQPRPEPPTLTAGTLRAVLEGIPDDAPVLTPQWTAGSVTVSAEGVLITKRASAGTANRPNQSVSVADRAVMLGAFAAKVLGRKLSASFTQQEAAEAMEPVCSPFVISYSIKSEAALTEFTKRGLVVTGPEKKVYSVSKAA